MSDNNTQPQNNADTPTARWTEIEHLPAWTEEFYDVYTAKKLGKWVMLKTLKPEYRDKPEYVAMLHKEFDVRYNLSHPNIVMINDFEEVPGVGLSIICDDVYGQSLRKLLDEGKFTDHHYRQLVTRLPMAMEYIQQNHLAHNPISLDTIVFTDKIGNLKLIDVGFDQKRSLSHTDTNHDIRHYGNVMLTVLDRTMRQDTRMHRIAERAAAGGYRDVQGLQLALAGQNYRRVYAVGIVLLLAMAAALVWLLTHPAGAVR